MKRFLAFCGRFYYPVGGMDDFIGAFDSLAEAEQGINVFFVEKDEEDWSGKGDRWSHVLDLQTMEVYRQAYS